MIPGCCFSHRFILISRIHVGEIIKDPMNPQRSAPHIQQQKTHTFGEREFVTVENKSFFNLSLTDESLLWRSLLLSITTKHQQWKRTQNLANCRLPEISNICMKLKCKAADLIWFCTNEMGSSSGKLITNEIQIICILHLVCTRTNYFSFHT